MLDACGYFLNLKYSSSIYCLLCVRRGPYTNTNGRPGTELPPPLRCSTSSIENIQSKRALGDVRCSVACVRVRGVVSPVKKASYLNEWSLSTLLFFLSALFPVLPLLGFLGFTRNRSGVFLWGLSPHKSALRGSGLKGRATSPSLSRPGGLGAWLVRAAWERRPEGPSYLLSTVKFNQRACVGCCFCTDAEGGVARTRGWLVGEPGVRLSPEATGRFAVAIFATPVALVTRMLEAA